MAEFECTLPNRVLGGLLDEATRTWLIDDDALDEVENDLQSIINCTREGDVVLFDVARSIRPVRRVTIPWNLTLSANTESADLGGGVFPRTRAKATFRCPSRNEGVFFVRYDQSLSFDRHPKAWSLQVQRCVDCQSRIQRMQLRWPR